MIKKEIKKYDYIDALRGLAILGVLVVHTSQNFSPSNSILKFLTSLGSSGVQLFFIASALTLSFSWKHRVLKEKNHLINFFIRRLLRIAPLFWVAIIFYTYLFGTQITYFAPNGINAWSILSTFLFIHGFHPETFSAVVPGGWSIAVEMTFYLFFPFLITKLKTVKLKFIFIFISLLSFPIMQTLMVNYFQSYSVELVHDFVSLNIVGQLAVFAIGLFTYDIVINYKFMKKWIIRALILFLCMLILFIFYPYEPRIVNTTVIFSFCYAVLTVFLSQKPISLLVNKYTIAIGKLSFSMYLSHFAIIHIIVKSNLSDKIAINNLNLKFLIILLVVTLSSFLISKILYRIIENPGINLGKILIRKIEISLDK